MPLKWSNQLFSTGVPAIDEQHKNLFRRLNFLSDEMRLGKGREAIEAALDYVDGYAKEHFCFEEDVMVGRQCSGCNANKAQHEEFLVNLSDIRARLNTEGSNPQLIQDVYRNLM